MRRHGSVRRFSPFTLLLTGLFLVGLALPVQAADPSARDAVETSLPEPTDPDVRAHEREVLITF